jgi:hypothetical protein
MAKVGVCLSSGGMVHASFAVCAMALVANSAVSGVDIAIINAESSLNMVNRDAAALRARAGGCTHVLLIDSDMEFPPDTLLRLLGADKPIVGALYARRVAPYATLGRLVDPDTKDAIAEAEEMGVGCVLIRTNVFDKMRRPYFRCPSVEKLWDLQPELAGFDMTGIREGETIDDSIWFSKAARRAGFKLWVDRALTLEVGHTGSSTHYVKAI